MDDIDLIDSCLAHLHVQDASNIESIRQKCHRCCDWQRAITWVARAKQAFFAPLAVRVHTGCSAFRFTRQQNR